jgi:hypothetical protein
MKNSKQVIGLLNTTLKGIRITNGENATEESARLIMQGILISISSKKVADEFIDYCFDNYTIKLNMNEQQTHLHKPDVIGSALSDLAKDIYFKDVLNEKYRDNFLSELQKRKVIDKRENGFYCCYCAKISEKETAFVQMDRVIFPKNNQLELWLVNSHYDGCSGWD